MYFGLQNKMDVPYKLTVLIQENLPSLLLVTTGKTNKTEQTNDIKNHSKK